MAAKRAVVKRKKTKVSPKGKRPALGLDLLAYLGMGLAVAAVGLFTLPNYRQLLPAGYPLGHLPTFSLLVAAFVGMVFLWRRVPETGIDNWDISSRTARIFFWGFMIFGACMRMYRPDQPTGFFWDDHYIITADIRNTLDYNERPFLFPSGWREPFFPYLCAFFWATVIPKAGGVFAVRFGSTVIDLIALWVFYLLGKEIGGRRMGLFLLAFGAVSKTMIEVSMEGNGCDTTILACALSLLFFLRAVKKPDLRHFALWGLALGLGAFTYVPFRVWVPMILTFMVLFVFYDRKERKWDWTRLVLGPGLWVVWIFMFFYQNSFLSAENPLVHFLTGPFFLVPLAGLLGTAYVLAFRKETAKGKAPSKVIGWATGAVVTALVMSPFYLNPHYSSHTSDISVFSKYFTTSREEGWRHLWENFPFGFRLMWGVVDHVSRLPAIGDSVFDFHVTLFALVGAAYFIARPTWLKGLFVTLFVGSYVPFVLSNGPHTFRLMGNILPFTVVAVWGAYRLYLAILQSGNPVQRNRIAAALFLLFFAWEGYKNFGLVWYWMGQKGTDSVIGDQAEKEIPEYRPYMIRHHPGFYTSAIDILCDNHEIYRMNSTNAVDLAPGEKRKGLAIMVAGEDKLNQQLVERAFPGLPWKERSIYWQPAGETPFLKWMEVPFDHIPKGETGLFHFREASAGSWRRRCYGHYGMGRGLILYEDRVSHWNEVQPPADCVDWNNSMRVEGDWTVKTGGDYRFTFHTANVLWFFLDGKKVMSVPPRASLDPVTYKTSLTPGVHHVELVTSFTWEHKVPVLSVLAPGAAAEVPLDDLALSTNP